MWIYLGIFPDLLENDQVLWYTVLMDTNLINGLLADLDPDIRCISYEVDGDILRLYVESVRSDVRCPECGQPSAKRHSVYPKKFRDLPALGKKVEIVMKNRVMFCENPECGRSTFSERFEFLKPYGRKTDRLWDKIEDIALNTSSVKASATLRDGIADVSKSTLCAREKQPPPLVDPNTIAFLGVDDWAKRKRESYGSIFIDMETHRVIDLLDSREKDAVAAHLTRYSNAVVVLRDGSQSYRAAIDKALPDAVQVSDFFHLIKGLTDALRSYLNHQLPATITINRESSNGESSINPRWISKLPENAHERRTRERAEAKAEQHRKIAAMKAEGYTERQIAAELGISVSTVRKKLKPGYSPVDPRTGSSNGGGEIARYAGKVCALFEKGLPLTKILEAIKADGFSGGYYAVQNYVAREKRRRTAAAVHAGQSVIERRKAVAIMYNRKKPPLTSDEVNAVADAYPEYGVIIDLVNEFRELFSTRDTSGLDVWLEKALSLDIAALTTFVNGVKKDIGAVKAAILLRMTSGAVEGSVNKLKVDKRIMYGRCSFELLRGKLLRSEERKIRRQQVAPAV